MVNEPHVRYVRALTIDGGSDFRLKKDPAPTGKSCDEATYGLRSMQAKNSEHNDKPAQTRKRTVKLERLTSTIPRGGPTAHETLKASTK